MVARVAIIGAGACGIAAAKALRERDIAYVCFEKGDRVGGNWVYENPNGLSSAYRGLHINTSREKMQFDGFPMPAHFPDFPHHTQVAEYFEATVDRFGLREHIRFGAAVERVEPEPGGGFRVAVRGHEPVSFEAVLVANGHHWDPRWPDPRPSGTFAGRELHSHAYRVPEEFRGQRVLVVGLGNSAMDIAVEVSEVARTTVLSARRGAHILPKYLAGRPIDQFGGSGRWTLPLPRAARFRLFEWILRCVQGDPCRFGLPRPDHRLGQAHPTISSRILDRLAHGAVRARPGIAGFEGHLVRFADGTAEDFDAIVYCTGYRVTFPFLDPGLVSAPENDLPLYRRVFHPDLPGLAFIGLLQPLGAVMPIAEAQGRWVARWLLGEVALPPPSEMRRAMAAERAAVARRYVRSARHTMQVDPEDYLRSLARA